MGRGDTFRQLTVGSLSDREIGEFARDESGVERTSPLILDLPQQRPRTGAVALMTAVLEEAIRSCFSSGPQIRAEAEAWLMSGQRKSVFSFLTICESLGLDPLATRRAIRRLAYNGARRRQVRRARMNVRRATSLSEPMRPKRSNADR